MYRLFTVHRNRFTIELTELIIPIRPSHSKRKRLAPEKFQKNEIPLIRRQFPEPPGTGLVAGSCTAAHRDDSPYLR